MKKVILALIICVFSLVSFNSYAISLDDIVKTDDEGRIAISGDDIGKDLEENIMKKVDEEIEKVSKDIEGKVDELKAKADAEIDRVKKVVDDAKEELEVIKRIKAKVKGYIRMAYIAGGILAVFLIILILLLIKLWFKVSKIGKIGYAFKTIKNIDKRITALEKKAAKL